MSFAKHHLFPVQLQAIAQYAKALSHPARIFILETLMREDDLTVNELTRRMPLSRSSVSQHLEILRSYKFVRFREEVPCIFYRADRKVILKALNCMEEFNLGIQQKASGLVKII